jgi:phosphonate transport system substrate-binding protein
MGRICRFSIAAGLLLAHATMAWAQSPLRLGSVAMDIPAVMQQRLDPLTEYLSRTLDQTVELRLSADMASAIEACSEATVDLSYLTPVAYVRTREHNPSARLIAKTVTRGKDSFQLMIAVRWDSPIRRVDDLAGKRFAFGDRAALLQRAVVRGAGMPLDRLGAHEFVGHYDNIVRAVINGDFDAGILKDTMAYQWEDKGIRVIYASPDLPPYAIVACSGAALSRYADLHNAFVGLDTGEPRDLDIIRALDPRYDGFAATDDEEYDIVRRLIAPFRTNGT